MSAKHIYLARTSWPFGKCYTTNVIWLEYPEYSGKATYNATIWLDYGTFCPEFPDFLEYPCKM